MRARGSRGRRPRHLGLVVLLVLLLAACGGNKGQQARTVGQMIDDVGRSLGQSSMDDVAAGRAGSLDDAFRASSGAVDDALRVTAFDDAVQRAVPVADGAVAAHVDGVFANFDDVLQRRVATKLRTMICEARLLAYGEQGNIQLFRPWIEQEFAEIQVRLNGGYDTVATWLTEKVNDKTDTYSLACMVWARAAR